MSESTQQPGLPALGGTEPSNADAGPSGHPEPQEHPPHTEPDDTSPGPGAHPSQSYEPEDTADDRPLADGTGATEPETFEETTGARENSLLKVARSALAFGGGPATYIENNAYGAGVGPSKADIQIVPVSEDIRTPLVEVPKQVDMESGLREHQVVALYGREGSGRRTTAVSLLSRFSEPPGTVSVLYCEDTDIVQALCAQADQILQEGSGYLLEAGDRPVTAQVLDRLAQVAELAGAYLVVTGLPVSFPGTAHHVPVIEHRAPAARSVLERHLASLFVQSPSHGAQDEADAEKLVSRLDSEGHLEKALALARSVADVVQLAHLLAESFRSDLDDLDDIVVRWRDRLQLLAQELLGLGARQGESEKPNTHERAFRIAYALFDGLPMSDVVEAGNLLSRRMTSHFDVSAEAESRRDPHIDRLVPREMRAPESTTGPERARLVDDQLLRVMLDTVWATYGGFRRPFLEWLDDLTGRPGPGRERVRVRASQLAGLLMRREFDFVYRERVAPWARSESGARRLCAALAVEMAAAEDGPARRVATRVQQWAHSPSRTMQDTAARAYGTSIGLRDLQDTLSELTMLGMRPELAAASSVAHSTAWLFLADQVGEVMTTLEKWTGSRNDYLPRHAVLTMLALGRYTVRGGRPVLAELALNNAGYADLLAALWQRALLSKGTSMRSWRLMSRWLRDADGEGNDDLAALYESLAERIFTGPLKQRARFHLTHVWQRDHPDSPTLQRLVNHRQPRTSDNAEGTDRV
ncbi:hypothetical protein ACIQCD_18540 [Streptomyces sp. NPDC093250]|uniref:hypothetical protein n=1 Tax=Streptomyces sp. NPDC093250 TaxID=3366036 RepID=UPI003815B2D6